MRIIWRTGLPCLLVTLPALCLQAQAQAEESERVLEEVVVFGSLVQRPDYISPSPTFTIDAKTLAQDGTATLSGFLNKSPQFSPAFDRTSNNPGFGRGEVDLRGLGSQRTLVLLNGKRLGPAGSDGAVDINVIPAVLVDKVEVLTGGASAVYGSDAVSGALNVVLKRDFEGLEVGGGYGVTDRDDGDSWDFHLAGGFSFLRGRGKFTAFYAHTDRQEIETAAREFSAQPLSEDFATGVLQPFGSPISPSGWIPIPAFIDGAFSEGGLTFFDNGDPHAFDPVADGYNFYSEFNYLQTALERDTAGLFSRFDFTGTLSGYLDLTWASIETSSDIAPIPAFTFATVNLDNPFLTDPARQVLAANYDPGNTGFFVGPYGIRLSQNGPRFSAYDRENYHGSIGLSGRFSQAWSWQASYTYTEHTSDIVRGNQVFASRFEQSFLVDPATGQCFDTSNGCVGGDYFGAGKLTPELLAFLRAPDLNDKESSDQQVVQFITRGEFTLGSWRSVSLALGAEYREDTSSYQVDPQADSDDILRAGGSITGNAGSFDVSEIYVEAVLPLVEDKRWARHLLLDAGVRYSDYSSAGSAPSWKLGLTWEVIDGFMLRGMAQRAVRAPNIKELFSSSVTSLVTDIFEDDPCSASRDPVGQGVSDICIAQGLNPELLGVYEETPFYPRSAESTGNESLEAEEADTFTAGFTWQPGTIDGLSLALDYYSIEIENAITTLSAESLLLSCFETGDPGSKFCRSASRDETGNIAYVRVAPLNASRLSARGIDLQLEYRLQLPAVNKRWNSSLGLSLVGNKVTDYSFKADPASPARDCAGSFGIPCDFTSTGSNPEHRLNTTVSYQVGGLAVTGIWRWIESIDNAGNLLPDLDGAKLVPDSGSRNYFDLNLVFEPTDWISLYAGVANVTDADPPLLGFNSQQSNTNPNLFDVLGRRYHLSLRVRI